MWSLALSLALALAEPPPYDPDLPPKYTPLERDPEPPRGEAALVLGVVGMVVAGPMVPLGTSFIVVTDASALGVILLGTGAVVAGVATASLIVGVNRNKKWKTWAARHPDRVSRLQPRTERLGRTRELRLRDRGPLLIAQGSFTLAPTPVRHISSSVPSPSATSIG